MGATVLDSMKKNGVAGAGQEAGRRLRAADCEARFIFGGEREREMIYECKKLLGHNFCGTSDAAYASHVSLLYPVAKERGCIGWV